MNVTFLLFVVVVVVDINTLDSTLFLFFRHFSRQYRRIIAFLPRQAQASKRHRIDAPGMEEAADGIAGETLKCANVYL